MINLIELKRQQRYIEMKQAIEAFKVEIAEIMKEK